MLIYPSFLDGERLGGCSDDAQLHFPRIASIANGYGRMALSATAILAAAYGSIKAKPTVEQIKGWLREYYQRGLLFVYSGPFGVPWGQWCGTPTGALTKYKSGKDKQSPGPPPEELERYTSQYAEEQARCAEVSGDFPTFQKSSENFESLPKISAGVVVVEGVVVGVVEGVGVGEGVRERESAASPASPPVPRERKRSKRKDNVSDEDLRQAQPYADEWNTHGGDLPGVLALPPERVAGILRCKAQGITPEMLGQAADIASRTPFCRGKNEKGWQVTFDWLLKDTTNLYRIVERAYGEPEPPKTQFVPANPHEAWADLAGAAFPESEAANA